MDTSTRTAAEAFAWVRSRFPRAAPQDLSGSAMSYLEARAAAVCAKSCTGAENCRFKGYRPALCEEDGTYVVRWSACRAARRHTEQPKAPPLCPVPPVYASRSFANFSTSGSPGYAVLLSAAKSCAARRQNLILLGPGATGKTHLAAAYARILEQAGGSVVFFTGMEYFERLRASFHGGPEVEALTRSADLAVFDDMCASRLSEWCSAKFFEAIDFRYRRRLPFVVTSGVMTTAAFAVAAGPSGRKCADRFADKAAGACISLAQAPPYAGLTQTTLFPVPDAGPARSSAI